MKNGIIRQQRQVVTITIVRGADMSSAQHFDRFAQLAATVREAERAGTEPPRCITCARPFAISSHRAPGALAVIDAPGLDKPTTCGVCETCADMKDSAMADLMQQNLGAPCKIVSSRTHVPDRVNGSGWNWPSAARCQR